MGLSSFKVMSFSAAKRFPVLMGEALAPFTVLSFFYSSAHFHNKSNCDMIVSVVCKLVHSDGVQNRAKRATTHTPLLQENKTKLRTPSPLK